MSLNGHTADGAKGGLVVIRSAAKKTEEAGA